MNNTHAKIARLLSVGVLTGSLILSALPVAAEQELTELYIQGGSAKAAVNGQAMTIAAPYTKNGTMMVPVGVFKKAFNTQVRLESTRNVKLISGSRVVSMTIDSRTAYIGGSKVTLPAAPEMKNGYLMVPLRPVAEGLGGKLAGNAGGVTVRMAAQEGETEIISDTPQIDQDQGKSKIGNSYYGWSMNYPTGLVIGQAGSDESTSTFMDENGDYYMEVHVTPQPIPLDGDDLLQQLVQEAKDTGEMILDRKSFGEGEVPYARVITKGTDGSMWENRMYYAHDKLYTVYLSDPAATNYKDLNKHSALLGSFKTSFNAQDRTIKDLSTVEAGMKSVYNSDYGISLQVPAGWLIDNSQLNFEGNDSSYLSITVSSAPADAKEEDWNAQLQQWLRDSFTASAYQAVKTYPMKVAGKAAIVHEYRYNFGDGWVKEYDVMLQVEGYRYFVEYSVPDDESTKGKDEFQRIISSLKIDYSVVAENFGQLEDNQYLTDKTTSAKKISKAYEYSVEIPRYWTAVSDRFESGYVEYQFVGGRFAIRINSDDPFDMQVSRLKDFYADEAKGYSNLKVEQVKDIQFAGVPAVSFTFHRTDNGVGYTGRQILLEHNGSTYTISTVLNDANNTAAQAVALDSALNSFTLVK